jgi:hypothetical protein
MELVTIIFFLPNFYNFFELFLGNFIFDHPLMMNVKYKNVTKPFDHSGIEFSEMSLNRWVYMLECLEKGLTIMFLDIDIIIKRSYKDIVLKMVEEYDVVLQDNDKYYNIGCMAMKPNERTISFCKKVIEKMKFTRGIDQLLANQIIKETPELKVGKFGVEFYSNHLENLKYPSFIPDNCILFHATNTYTMDEKYNLMVDAINRIK